MVKKRFVDVYNQRLINVIKVVVDMGTGINYVMDKKSNLP